MLTEQQFTDAAERYLDMVYRIALNWFRNPAGAEDAAESACRKTGASFDAGSDLHFPLIPHYQTPLQYAFQHKSSNDQY